ncbi:universal stress protein [Streptomyces sp. NPDC004327]|uniref:universal stress protein n=1 Tax=Streptomyces sp. NPDC004327 TaxID=3364699 RepID=UPI0036CF8180
MPAVSASHHGPPATVLRDRTAGAALAVAERRRLLAESVAGCAERHPDVDVTRSIVRGHPVEELARASRQGLAVVVGRRGRGGYSGMRLGSTVHGLLHHADCPVITVPLPETGGTDEIPGRADRSRPLTPLTDRSAPAG